MKNSVVAQIRTPTDEELTGMRDPGYFCDNR